jgi:hypothetical protein
MIAFVFKEFRKKLRHMFKITFGSFPQGSQNAYSKSNAIHLASEDFKKLNNSHFPA